MGSFILSAVPSLGLCLSFLPSLLSRIRRGLLFSLLAFNASGLRLSVFFFSIFCSRSITSRPTPLSHHSSPDPLACVCVCGGGWGLDEETRYM